MVHLEVGLEGFEPELWQFRRDAVPHKRFQLLFGRPDFLIRRDLRTQVLGHTFGLLVSCSKKFVSYAD